MRNRFRDILTREDHPRDRVPGRVAEHQRFPGRVGRRTQQALVVGVAAHHPVQHQDIRGLDTGRVGRDVQRPPVHSAPQPGLADESLRLVLVRRGQLKVQRGRSAPLDQLELDLADPSADLEHRLTHWAAPVQELDHSSPDLARWQARPGLELEGTRLARSRGAALQQLRGGDVATGLAAYANAGRVVTRDTADAQRAANVARWWPAAQAGDRPRR